MKTLKMNILKNDVGNILHYTTTAKSWPVYYKPLV